MNIIVNKTYPFQDVKQCKGLESGKVKQNSNAFCVVNKHWK